MRCDAQHSRQKNPLTNSSVTGIRYDNLFINFVLLESVDAGVRIHRVGLKDRQVATASTASGQYGKIDQKG